MTKPFDPSIFAAPFYDLVDMADGTGKPCFKIPCSSEYEPRNEAAATVDHQDDPDGGSPMPVTHM